MCDTLHLSMWCKRNTLKVTEKNSMEKWRIQKFSEDCIKFNICKLQKYVFDETERFLYNV